ncbi:MAG: molybdate ABC transporter substrate-binding protein [Deltaproteobacteria bacterium]
MRFLTSCVLLSVLVFCSCAKNPTVEVDGICETGLRVAVADVFTGAAVKLAEDFSRRTGNRVCITTGASGELVEKIRLGFEYEVFMSDDTEHPELLVSEGRADSLVVYALSTISLYSTYWKLNRTGEEYLRSGQFNRIAVVDPEKSPHGRAAAEALESMGLYEKVRHKVVYGESIVGTLALVRAKEAEAGFVAYPELRDKDRRWAWPIPEDMHEPIEQAAVVLAGSNEKEAASLWMKYIVSEAGRGIIRKAGYRLGESGAERE